MPVPLRGEAARNPFTRPSDSAICSARRPTWERVFTAPPADSVILLSNWNWTLSRTRRERLQRWVEVGGRLIVDDSVMADLEEFETWSGISQHDREEAEEERRKRNRKRSPTKRPTKKSPNLPSRTNIHSPRVCFEADCHALTEDGSERKLEVCDVNRTRSLTSDAQDPLGLAR